MDKKINIQILFVEVIRFFFILTMILGVSLVSIHNGNKDAQMMDSTRDVLQTKAFLSSAGENRTTVAYNLPLKYRHKKEHKVYRYSKVLLTKKGFYL